MRRFVVSAATGGRRRGGLSAAIVGGLALVLVGAMAAPGLAGPYAPAAGQVGSTALFKDDSAFVAWATGYTNYLVGTDVLAEWQTPAKATDKAQGIVSGVHDVVSLGNGGQITLTFAQPIFNGPGFDLAVFENGLSDNFLELAWVEVSADGANFVRFPNDSLTPSPVPAFGGIDPTNVNGLAGKYRHSYGTAFDLTAVGLTQATHVRIVDIKGDGTALDTSGDVIYDPWQTVDSGGFDLDAVGVLNVPEPASLTLLLAGVLLIAGRRRIA